MCLNACFDSRRVFTSCYGINKSPADVAYISAVVASWHLRSKDLDLHWLHRGICCVCFFCCIIVVVFKIDVWTCWVLDV